MTAATETPTPRPCPYCGQDVATLGIVQGALHVDACARASTQAVIDEDVTDEREGRAWARRRQPSSTYDEVSADLERVDVCPECVRDVGCPPGVCVLGRERARGAR